MNAYAHMCRMDHEEIGHNDSEHEDCPLCRMQNDRDALAERCEKLLEALREAERGFELAYNAAEKGLIDEVLLHCGAHVAKISTALFQTAIKRRKHNEI